MTSFTTRQIFSSLFRGVIPRDIRGHHKWRHLEPKNKQILCCNLFCFENTLSVSVATNGIATGDEVFVVIIGAVVWAIVGAIVLVRIVVVSAVLNSVVVIGVVTIGAKGSTFIVWTGVGEIGEDAARDLVEDEKIFSAHWRTTASLRQVIGSNLSLSRSSTTQIWKYFEFQFFCCLWMRFLREMLQSYYIKWWKHV